MARLSEQEKKDLVDQGSSLTRSVERAKKKKTCTFHGPDGSLHAEALTSFLYQVNVLLGHPRKPFRPIVGDRFLL